MNNIDELLNTWSEAKTFKELPYRHIMPYCTVTIDEPEKKSLDELLGNIRHRINNKVKSIREKKGVDKMERVNPLEEVVCLSEAAALVGYTEGSLRNWIKVNRIKAGEYKKSGRITLVLKSAVMREAGRGNN